MVGIVLVCHSRALAEGVAELVRGVTESELALAVSGGVDDPEQPLGTDATDVLRAIEEVYSEDGVVVLMDLGSAVLSAETALDLMEAERRSRVTLLAAPLVEGAVSAAVQASMGAGLEEVVEEARRALEPKAGHLGDEAETPPPRGAPPEEDGEWSEVELEVPNPQGLHARPAARFVQASRDLEADVRVENLSTGKGPVSGRSLNAIATLGVQQGHRIRVGARGPQADQTLAAIQELAGTGFGDRQAAPAAAERPGARAASPGLAIGPVRRLRVGQIELPERPVEDPEGEWRRFEQAVERIQERLRRIRKDVEQRAGEYQAAIFDAHLLFLEDEELLVPTRRAVLEESLDAATAWWRTVSGMAERYQALDDQYQRERAVDLDAVGRQLVEELTGGGTGSFQPTGPGVLVAPDLTPAQTAALDTQQVQAIVTAGGSPTSHASILSRSLGIPAVVGAGPWVLELEEGTMVVVDGDHGEIHVEPGEEQAERFRSRIAEREALRRELEDVARQPALTRDGRRMEVAANVGGPHQVPEALEMGAEGIGLLRSEFLFLGRATMPEEEEQYQTYLRIMEGMKGRPVILRTLDVGGDKPLPYLSQPNEDNPFLGLRGIRLALRNQDVLSVQLRAAARVAAEHPLKLMFPMVATLGELRQAKELAQAAGWPAGRELGVMVETPALALTASAFAPEIDFFSVGTNDLTQYVLAAERGNPHVSALADPVHPGVLHLIRRVVTAGRDHDVWVGICGEVAGDAATAALWVGLGVDELSMSPPSIPEVKAAIREIDTDAARRLADRAVELGSAEEVRRLLER